MTTSSSTPGVAFARNRFLHALAILFLIVWIWSVISPSFGLLLYFPQREVLMRKAGLACGWLLALPVFTTLAFSAVYEMIEAVVANIVDPVDAAAFLGAQGDPWDSQEDMFMALIGAVISAALLAVTRGSGSANPTR